MKIYKILLFLGAFIFIHIQDLKAQKQFKALLIVTTKGWHHESIHAGVLALQQLAVKNNFELTLFEDPNSFTDKNLESYKLVIFLNTTGDIFDSTQQKVMERFIHSGKGFVGIHSASDTEYDWPWYTQLVGRMFHIHPLIQTAKIQVLDPEFPGLQAFSGGKLWTDEWYEFDADKIQGLHNILSVDESTYNPKADWGTKKGIGMGKLHPISWYHEFDGGRSFYTALGHLPSIYSDPIFLNHLYAGIFWAATGKK